MTESPDWKQEVADWRASGLTAEEFTKDRGYTSARLWGWSSRLLKAQRKAAGGDDVQLVPVVRSKTSEDSTAVTVHLHDARIVVRPGADRATLTAVLEAVDRLRRAAGAQ